MTIRSSLMTALLAAAFTSPAAFAQSDCVLSVESAAYVVDVSGSMMQKFSVETSDGSKKDFQKLTAAKDLVARINRAANPEAKLPVSLFTVAPYTAQLALDLHSAKDLQQALDRLNPKLEVFGRPTWIGRRASERFNEAVGRPQTVILFTDGAFQKDRLDPVEALNSFHAANPDSCIHFVSLAQTEEEKAGVEALSGVMPCSKTVRFADLVKDEKAFQKFVADLFPLQCREPEKAPAVVIKGVNFDFDKSTLTPEAVKLLTHALEVIRARGADEPVRIVGWTDYYGSDAYNKGLSERCAAAVKVFLVEHGVAENRISEAGRGKSFKYTNKTRHGRWQNRRVDLILGDGALVSEDAL